MNLLIVSGLSGAGKSVAMNALEDIGFFCIDNIPAALLPSITAFSKAGDNQLKRVALCMDIRGCRTPEEIEVALSQLDAQGIEYEILFLDAPDDVLMRRYSETRRRHPMSISDGLSTREAFRREREILQPLKDRADYTINTGLLSTSQNKERICNLFNQNGGAKSAMRLTVMSFGFKFGIPPEADLVLDVRCLPNPFYIMRFASQARDEIARRSLQKDCCVRAAAYGIACFAKYFDASGLVLQTEQELTTQVASQLFARCGVQGDIIEKQRPSGVVYEFSIRAPEQVARMHELFGTTGTETSLQIDPRLIRCQTCVSAYIGAAFLCSGTVTDPQKEYNIEFLTSRTNLARDFEALLAEHEFAPHRTRRNGVNLVYVKSCDNVERILSFMGAAEASAQLSAQKAVKQMRNQINRHTNCDTANLGKTARANAQTLKAIRFLEEQGALKTLPEALQQAAARRLEYPDLSLTALCGCFDPPMSKSGLSHRMKKLEALADALRQRLEEHTETEEAGA